MLGFLVWGYRGAKEGYEKGRAASPLSSIDGFLRESHPGCVAGAVQGTPSILDPFDSRRSVWRACARMCDF